MSRWFRFYDDAINDPKILRLSDAMFRAWVTLLCLASKGDGTLPKTSDIALVLRMKITKVADWLTELTVAGLLDNDEGVFRPHNWNARQYKSDVTDPTAALRQKAYRDRNKNRDEHRNDTVTVTGTRTEAETDNRNRSEKDSRAEALDDDWPKDFGDQFWQAYPRKTEKLAAMKKLAVVRKSKIVTFADLMAGVCRYAASNPEPQFTKHPTTWLNAGCWADETQIGANNGNGTRPQNRRPAGADFLAGMRSVAEDIVGDREAPGRAGEDIPLGRLNIDG